jgi:hypothetical protein
MHLPTPNYRPLTNSEYYQKYLRTVGLQSGVPKVYDAELPKSRLLISFIIDPTVDKIRGWNAYQNCLYNYQTRINITRDVDKMFAGAKDVEERNYIRTFNATKANYA